MLYVVLEKKSLFYNATEVQLDLIESVVKEQRRMKVEVVIGDNKVEKIQGWEWEGSSVVVKKSTWMRHFN